MDLTPVKNIDKVLKTFYEKGKNGLEWKEAQNEAGILDDEEYKRIHMQLREDKYIVVDQVRFIITYDGVMFYLSGGYMGQYDSKLAIAGMNQRMEKSAQDLVDWTQNLATRTRELRDWTRAVAIGAIGLVLWEIVKTAFFEKH